MPEITAEIRSSPPSSPELTSHCVEPHIPCLTSQGDVISSTPCTPVATPPDRGTSSSSHKGPPCPCPRPETERARTDTRLADPLFPTPSSLHRFDDPTVILKGDVGAGDKSAAAAAAANKRGCAKRQCQHKVYTPQGGRICYDVAYPLSRPLWLSTSPSPSLLLIVHGIVFGCLAVLALADPSGSLEIEVSLFVSAPTTLLRTPSPT